MKLKNHSTKFSYKILITKAFFFVKTCGTFTFLHWEYLLGCTGEKVNGECVWVLHFEKGGGKIIN